MVSLLTCSWKDGALPIQEADPGSREFQGDDDRHNELLNYNGKSKGKGKGKSKSAASQESEQNSFPANHTSHSTNAKFPFTITFALVADEIDHWGTWKELWNRALTNANTPYQIHVLSEDF